MDSLREAEITIFTSPMGGTNASGKPYVKVQPYVRIRTRNTVTGDWENAEGQFIPCKVLSLETQAHYDQPYRVVIESVPDGAFPSNASRPSGMTATDNVELHQYNYL